MKKLYVGNLDFQTTEEELHELFEPYGTVERVTMPCDFATGKPRGFAFVEMKNENDAAEAMLALNGARLGNRTLVVNKAHPRVARADTGRGERRFGRG
jgi:RNA recognition motif-containing protein